MAHDIVDSVLQPASSRSDAVQPRLLVLLSDAGENASLASLATLQGESRFNVLSISSGRGNRSEFLKGVEITEIQMSATGGHGALQKLGLRYALENDFDVVVSLSRGIDASSIRLATEVAFSSPPLGAALGPRTKGSPIHGLLARGLAFIQWKLLRMDVAPFDASFRIYAVEAVKSVPFERNSNDVRFDTELAIQLLSSNVPVERIASSEARGASALSAAAAWKILRATLRATFHRKALLYDRKFDVEPVEETYDLKLGFPSSHTAAIAAVRSGSSVLDLGCGRGYVAREFAKKAGRVTAVDRYDPGIRSIRNIDFHRWDLDGGDSPVDVSQYEQIFMLDIIEHLGDPEDFMEKLRVAAARTRPEIILTTANVAFVVTRVMLLFGHFNYGRKGILDRTHTRLFTITSLRELMEQTGYTIEEVKGIPAPYARVLGINWMSKALAWTNEVLIGMNRGLFSYQIFLRARANPTVHNLLVELEENRASANETAGCEQSL